MTINHRRLLAAAVLALLPAPALAKCGLTQLAELKVTMDGRVPMVDTALNGKATRLVLDSGAFYSIISPAAAAELGLRVVEAPDGFSIRTTAGERNMRLTTVKDFALAGATFHNVQFIVADLGIGASGVLGQNVLGLADVEYDLGHGVARLMRPDDCQNSPLAYWATGKPIAVLDLAPRTPEQRLTTANVLVNGTTIRAAFDTGAQTSVLSLGAAARSGVTPDSPGVVAAGFANGVGSRGTRTWVAPFASLKFGDGEEIRRIKLRIGQSDLAGADMLIGADFFLSHHIYVSNRQHRMYFTYDGGPIFDLTAHQAPPDAAAATPDDPGQPRDAEGYGRRGAAFVARQQYDRAIADFTRAMELAPGDARYPFQRAMARFAAKDRAPGIADIDKALALDPNAIDAHIVRGSLRAGDGDIAGAREDADAADRLATPASDRHLDLADLYTQLDAFDRVVAQYDLWLRAHPTDGRRVFALNGRCWARAQSGRDLDKALDDCNEAVRLHPEMAGILDSRGMVQLRLGNLDRAIADYDAALAKNPNIAWSLYGRGLAKQRKGLKDEGAADIAAAVKLDAKLPERAKKLGITS